MPTTCTPVSVDQAALNLLRIAWAHQQRIEDYASLGYGMGATHDAYSATTGMVTATAILLNTNRTTARAILDGTTEPSSAA